MQLPPAPPRFAHISRYFDAANQRCVAKLLPGQFYLCRGETIVTVVGTGVAACIRDPVLGLGGMNHFLEPFATTAAESSLGEEAMLALVRGLLDAGAQRRDLEVKLFGGARILDPNCEIGARTIDTARRFLDHTGIALVEEDLGGSYPRKIDYCPQDGRLRVKRLRDLRNSTIVERDRRFLDACL
jgi:chemotaxis protein CheD